MNLRREWINATYDYQIAHDLDRIFTKLSRILKVIASYTVGIILAILLAIVSVVLAPAIYIWARRFINELLASWKDAEAFNEPKQITSN